MNNLKNLGKCDILMLGEFETFLTLNKTKGAKYETKKQDPVSVLRRYYRGTVCRSHVSVLRFRTCERGHSDPPLRNLDRFACVYAGCDSRCVYRLSFVQSLDGLSAVGCGVRLARITVPLVLQKVYGVPDSYPFLVLTVGIGEIIAAGILGMVVHRIVARTNLFK